VHLRSRTISFGMIAHIDAMRLSGCVD